MCEKFDKNIKSKKSARYSRLLGYYGALARGEHLFAPREKGELRVLHEQIGQKSGEHKRIEACYDRTNEKLWRYIHSILKNEADTYDIVQTAYMRLIIVLPKLKRLSETELDAYLTVIARNLALKCYAGRKKTLPSDILDRFTGNKGVETAIEERELRLLRKHALREALKQIPANYRELIFMKYYREYDNEKIAAMLHIKPQSVRMMQTRIIRCIRSHIRPHIEF